jgi:hypothetical protein
MAVGLGGRPTVARGCVTFPTRLELAESDEMVSAEDRVVLLTLERPVMLCRVAASPFPSQCR